MEVTNERNEQKKQNFLIKTLKWTNKNLNQPTILITNYQILFETNFILASAKTKPEIHLCFESEFIAFLAYMCPSWPRNHHVCTLHETLHMSHARLQSHFAHAMCSFWPLCMYHLNVLSCHAITSCPPCTSRIFNLLHHCTCQILHVTHAPQFFVHALWYAEKCPCQQLQNKSLWTPLLAMICNQGHHAHHTPACFIPTHLLATCLGYNHLSPQ
jgi:hypothetical protein